MNINYSKTKIETMVCQGINIKCKIEGKINYSFFPTPRIKIDNATIRFVYQHPLILDDGSIVGIDMSGLTYKFDF